MAEPRTAGPAPSVASRRRVVLLAAACSLALGSCVVTLWAAGALDPMPLPGIPLPNELVTWSVPLLRVVWDAAAVVTVGCLLGAVLLVPGDQILSAAGYRWVRAAGWGALVWALAALASLPVLLADFLGTKLSFITLRSVYGFVTTVDQGRAQFLVAVLAAVIAIAARAVLRPPGARILLVIALLATIPPAFTGHAADEESHDLAVASAAAHVLGVTLWAGGLVALVLAARLSGAARSAAVRRFSRLAPVFVAVVAASGVLNGLVRLSAPAQLVETSYGVVVLLKTVALLALAALGWAHRRLALPALDAQRPRAFLRLAVAEVLLFAVTIGIAVALTRTPDPAPDAAPDTATVVVGAETSAEPRGE